MNNFNVDDLLELGFFSSLNAHGSGISRGRSYLCLMAMYVIYSLQIFFIVV